MSWKLKTLDAVSIVVHFWSVKDESARIQIHHAKSTRLSWPFLGYSITFFPLFATENMYKHGRPSCRINSPVFALKVTVSSLLQGRIPHAIDYPIQTQFKPRYSNGAHRNETQVPNQKPTSDRHAAIEPTIIRVQRNGRQRREHPRESATSSDLVILQSCE